MNNASKAEDKDLHNALMPHRTEEMETKIKNKKRGKKLLGKDHKQIMEPEDDMMDDKEDSQNEETLNDLENIRDNPVCTYVCTSGW